MFVHCCHCKECQRHTGSAFVLNAIVEKENISVLSGEMAPCLVPTTSGQPHAIYHCISCQTALWSDYGDRGVLWFLRVGTLDDPTLMPPDVHIFTVSKQPWVIFPDGVPSFPVYYDPKTLWPPEMLERRRLAVSRGKET